MVAKNGNRTPSKTNNTNVGNTSRRPASYPQTRGKWKENGGVAKKCSNANQQNQHSKKSWGNIYNANKEKESDVESKNTLSKRNAARKNNILHTKNNKQLGNYI